ncbi:MAG: AAA family ATPase, partial [Nitrososphaerota archaeon]
MDIKAVKSILLKNPEQPKLLIGAPGIGKTQIVSEFAKEIGRKLYTIVLSHLDIDDLKGVPYVAPNGELQIKKGPLIPGEDEE